MITRFSHIAFLVRSVESAASYLNSLGIETGAPDVFESEGTKEIYVGHYDKQCGLLLLVEAISDGPYQRALSKRGPSLHHIAIDVLDVANFASDAQKIGWKGHAVNLQTIVKNRTAWLYLEGIPMLIEVNQQKELSTNPPKVSKVGISMEEQHGHLFEGIGLGSLIDRSPKDPWITIDGHRVPLSKLF